MVTHGAVIIDLASQTREFFGDHIPSGARAEVARYRPISADLLC